jgi:hypothetical protein
MIPTNHSSDYKLEQANKIYARSKKRQVYSPDDDSAFDISLECDNNSDNDINILVKICHLSKESIRKAIAHE